METESQIANGSCSCQPTQDADADAEEEESLLVYGLLCGKNCSNSTWAVERMRPLDVTSRKRDEDVP